MALKQTRSHQNIWKRAHDVLLCHKFGGTRQIKEYVCFYMLSAESYLKKKKSKLHVMWLVENWSAQQKKPKARTKKKKKGPSNEGEEYLRGFSAGCGENRLLLLSIYRTSSSKSKESKFQFLIREFPNSSTIRPQAVFQWKDLRRWK